MWAGNTNKVTFRIPAFDGGLNTKYTDVNMPVNQSPSLQNVMYDDYGAVYGWIKYTTEAPIYGTAAVSGAATMHTLSVDALGNYVTSAGTQYLAAGYNGSVWVKVVGSGSFDVIPSAVSMFSYGTYGSWTQYGFEQIENRLWVSNEGTTPHKWDGTKWSTVGVSNITGNLATAACGGTGALSGTYNYWITGVNSAGVEGDYATLTTGGLVIAAGQVTLSSLPTWQTSWGVDYVNIYRNTAGATAVPYLVGSTAATASTYTDNAADSTLTVEPPTDNGRPPNLKHVIYYRGRAFGFGTPAYPYRLFYSALGDPEVWPSDNYLEIGEGDGDPISGIAIYANSVTIHKNSGKNAGSIWILYMPDSLDVTDDSNWYLQKTSSAYGSCNQKSICFYNNLMFFFNRYGAFAFNGQDLAISAADSQIGRFAVNTLSFEIEPDIKALPVDYLRYAEAIQHDDKIWLTVVASASTRQKVTYVYDYLQASDPARQKGAWTKITQPSVHAMTTVNSLLYGSYGKDVGYVFNLNNTNYSGADITGGSGIALQTGLDSFFTTKKLYGYEEHRDMTKTWRFVNLLVDRPGDWFLEVYYGEDLDNTAGTYDTIDLNYDALDWGEFDWGVGTWSSTAIPRQWRRIVLQGMTSQNIQLKFRVRNNAAPYAAKTFKIYEMTIDYNLRGKR